MTLRIASAASASTAALACRVCRRKCGGMPTAIEGTDGRLWFSVDGGVVWLDPKRRSARLPAPPVSIQSVSADSERYELDQPLRFPAGTSNVQIGYAAVSLLRPDSIRFRYRLQGVDDNWRDAGTLTSVSYRSLPPGAYRFEVDASDANGIWSGKTATTQFTILPAYYQTTWFRALCALLLLALAWVAYQLRIRWLQRRFEMTLETRVAERTRIARDLHDTLLQSFHGLLLRFQTASNLLPDRPAESKQVLASAIDQAAEAITEGRDAVQGLRTSATEMNDLVDSLRALAEDLANENGNASSLRVEVQGTPRGSASDRARRGVPHRRRGAAQRLPPRRCEADRSGACATTSGSFGCGCATTARVSTRKCCVAEGRGRTFRVGRDAGAREACRRQAHRLERSRCGNGGGVEYSRAARVQ